ncbi:cobyrinate a,c-diamide synthase [Bartonella sp. HY329]|uniref:cobyrinate a,c-diamide synthase n=1 Tax=unclassified Bartonella TaxID=2645622 RepID=UPI0021C77E5B|nr:MULTISPECIES: cobyrinate a,c-diamide synthase [unclassified Bartonella]UXM94062.1 cobyrinate a,c-diamide synthase [Bartonella sp. HY329]UXN08384.1 cobyrinate a,c-diamide synthase [Bartonella sp. HY328]
MKGFMLASPHSGAGKTVLTMAILRKLARDGFSISPVKVGPDYIDPSFHEMACRNTGVNLDCWAMRSDLVSALSARAVEGGRLLIAEAMMGLFDGALDGTGSAADLARKLSLPIILVIDCSKMSHSIAPLVYGFNNFADDIYIAGVILNKVGSVRHEKLLRDALRPLSVNILGAIHRSEKLMLPERHLGLVQAHEMQNIDSFIDGAADFVADSLNFDGLLSLAKTTSDPDYSAGVPRLEPLGQHIAIARDNAFRFAYAHILAGWQRQGASLSFFSPLDNEAPSKDANAIFLPGGYPELFAEKLANASIFKNALQQAKADGKIIYGECGGYMVLGEYIEDKGGTLYPMLGLLPLITSIKKPKLHLGYRKLSPLSGAPWRQALRGHEFHYATTINAKVISPLFAVKDALDEDQGRVGMCHQNVSGSFLHVIDRE